LFKINGLAARVTWKLQYVASLWYFYYWVAWATLPYVDTMYILCQRRGKQSVNYIVFLHTKRAVVLYCLFFRHLCRIHRASCKSPLRRE